MRGAGLGGGGGGAKLMRRGTACTPFYSESESLDSCQVVPWASRVFFAVLLLAARALC
jgi:hypothetical protein